MAALVAFTFSAATFLTLSGALGQKVILMENFDPAQVEGMWYVVQRTASLYNDSAGCTTYNAKHKDGAIYEVEVDYMGKSNAMVKKMLRVVEDSDHPAQFYFADQDKRRVAVSFLGTDYKNWNVAYGYVFEGVPVYGVSSRTPVLDPKYLEEANEILKKNEVYGTMEICQPRQVK
ncbi:uncharacterized protein LOC144125128 [Amblyomma americanum]|uniref:Lipocalin/cytosolic fatty-acid binding domain-containing protein n=1 Tax=Amblyomma americanum TaxID=6943 RepID=A0AAQ4F198_AMBAM